MRRKKAFADGGDKLNYLRPISKPKVKLPQSPPSMLRSQDPQSIVRESELTVQKAKPDVGAIMRESEYKLRGRKQQNPG